MPRTRAPLRKTLAHAIADQEAWIIQCGRTLAGYVERYGSVHAPDFERFAEGVHGSGGEAIYAADMAELAKLRRAQKVPKRHPRRRA